MYEVVVSPEAECDLDEIIRYLAIDLANPQAATSLANKISARLDALTSMPAKFSFCKDAILRAHGYHRAQAGNYLIIYRIDESAKRVYVVHYYHTLQDYERDLLRFLGDQN